MLMGCVGSGIQPGRNDEVKRGEVQESAEQQARTHPHLDEEVELCYSSAAVGLLLVSCPREVSTRNPGSIVIGKIIGIFRGVGASGEATTGRDLVASSTRRGRYRPRTWNASLTQ